MPRLRFGVLLLCAALAAGPAPTAARPRCPSGCQACELDGCGNISDCIAEAQDKHDKCIANVPTIAGKCAWSSDRLDECNARFSGSKAACFDALRRKFQMDCRCRISRKAARRACNACGASVTPSSAPVTSVLRRARLVDEASADDPGGCQAKCIQSVIGSCYDDCADACADENPAALPFCQTGCRDVGCGQLKARCTSDGDRAAVYNSCCLVFGSCAQDVDCVVTTTLPTTTSTSIPTTTSKTATTTSSSTSSTMF